MTDLVFVDPTDTEFQISSSAEWQKIIDDASAIISESESEVPEKAIQVMEYLIAGYPMTKAAKAAKVTTKTIRTWLVRYPELGEAIRHGQNNLSRWRMSLLEQQFLDAATFSANLLSGEATTVNKDPKLLAIQAMQARYIMDLFTSKYQNLHFTQINNSTTVNTENVELKASKSGLDYIAEQLRKTPEKEVVEGVFIESPGREPLIDENGEPFYGEYGKIQVDDEGIMCHICGTKSSKLQAHIAAQHGLSPREYETTFSLDINEVMESDRRYTDRSSS